MVTLRRNTTAKKKKQTNLARLRIWSGKVAQVNKTKMLKALAKENK